MKAALLLILILTTLSTFGQKTEFGSSTLVNSKEKLVTSYISFDGQFVNLVNFDESIRTLDDVYCYGGATIASTINKAFTIGIIGAWRFNSFEITDNTILGYFGILLEPTIFSNFPIHITFPCSASVGIENKNSPGEEVEYKFNDMILVSGGARLELNITDGVRFSIGPSWRLNKDDLKIDFLNKPSFDFSIKIGKY